MMCRWSLFVWMLYGWQHGLLLGGLELHSIVGDELQYMLST